MDGGSLSRLTCMDFRDSAIAHAKEESSSDEVCEELAAIRSAVEKPSCIHLVLLINAVSDCRVDFKYSCSMLLAMLLPLPLAFSFPDPCAMTVRPLELELLAEAAL